MKTNRFFPLLICFLLAAGSCKRDEIASGPLAIRAHDFLSSSDYDQLVIEIAYVNGYTPSSNSVNNVVGFLAGRLNKPSGITLAYTAVPSPGKSAYSIDDLQKIEKDHRNHFSKGKTLTAFVFFADAPYAGNSGNSQILGVAYGTTSIGIFERTVLDNSGGIGEPSQEVLESTVIEHEFGHLMGLVDDGTPMVSAHLDVANGKHCTNRNCLMYYQAETTDALTMLTGGHVPELDANCIADLRANGGK